MYYLGRGLQVFGMGNLMVALYIGVSQEHGMGPEMILLGIGVLAFLLGRLLESRWR
ncbi:MAG: hypothetical protein ACE5K9_06165 [Candidatus Methylomirabilales bacterium]